MVNKKSHKMYIGRDGKPGHIRGGFKTHPGSHRITAHTVTYHKSGEHTTRTWSKQYRNSSGNKLRKDKYNYERSHYTGRNIRRRRVG